MSMLEAPQAPDYTVPWDELDHEFSWVRELKDCPQDPEFHAEGNVWIHTKMVCEELVKLQEWRSLEEADRDLLFGAAVLHDVAKPSCTREVDGRIRSPGHSRRGACMARRILWEMDYYFHDREQVCNLIKHHQDPFWTIERQEPQRLLARISQDTDCKFLSLLAEADIRGRICSDQQKTLDNIKLFQMMCEEMSCSGIPYEFPNAYSMFEYFRHPDRDIGYAAYDDTTSKVIMMSGLPGSGKDTWIGKSLDVPVVSLDEIRKEFKLPSSGNQADVVRIAKERCKELLRKKQDFVYNATNLTEKIRREWVGLFTGYNATVSIKYIETTKEKQALWNASRDAAVPERAIRSMLEDWEVPSKTEAHEVEYIIQ